MIRKFEEKLLFLYSEGHITGTLHTCIGQELAAILMIAQLSNEDSIFSTHRGHGHFIARTNDIEGLFAEILGKSTGVCGGIGGTQHLHAKGFYSNGIQGGMLPIGAGMALSYKLKSSNNIAAVFIGDGTLGQGIFYETINIASTLNLPLLIVIENNNYAQSTPSNQSLAGSIKGRAEAFGIGYRESNTWDIENLSSVAEEGVNHVRESRKPLIVEILTYRLGAHSKGDDFRDPSEIQKYLEKDFINTHLSTLSPSIGNMIKNIEIKIEKAVTKALNAPSSEINIFTPDHLTPILNWNKMDITPERISNVIYKSLKHLLSEYLNVILLGEDIEAPYGGAFKITKDLSVLFPNRVLNMPISESAIMGMATGLSIGGYFPIIEIMFGDFLTLIFDQLFNHACKFRTIYNNQIEIPLIIRTPMGGGRGYGPTHSQSLEKYFIGIPDLQLIALNSRVSPYLIYSNIIANFHHPVLVIENKVLYSKYLNAKNISGFDLYYSDESFPYLKISPVDISPDVTIFCYGGVLDDVEKAIESVFFDEEILCEVLCPSQIYPINIHPIIESVSTTKKLITIEEGSNICSLSSEIIAILYELKIEIKAIRRLGNNSIIPASTSNEFKVLNCKDRIKQAIIEVYHAQ